MLRLCTHGDLAGTERQIDCYAAMGLRTLALGHKTITQQQLENFLAALDSAGQSIVNRTTFVRYVNRTTFIMYVNKTIFIRYVNRTTFIRYVNRTLFIRYVNRTTLVRYVNRTTFVRYDFVEAFLQNRTL